MLPGFLPFYKEFYCHMKRILPIIAVILVVLSLFTACGSDASQYSDINSQLIGTWKLVDDTDGEKYGVLLCFKEDGTMLYGFDWSDFEDEASPDADNNILADALDTLGKNVKFTYSIENPSLIKVTSKIFILKSQDEVEFSIYKDSLTFNGHLYKRVKS